DELEEELKEKCQKEQLTVGNCTLCNVCNETEYKYTCPYCEKKYCSLICSKKHKTIFNCKNKLKKKIKIKNVNKANYDEDTLYHDFTLLNNVEKIVERNYKFIKIKEIENCYSNKISPIEYKKIIQNLKKKNIQLLKAPTFTQLHKINKSNINKKTNTIQWTIKTIFINVNIFIIHNYISQQTTFKEILHLSYNKNKKQHKSEIKIYLNDLSKIHVYLSNAVYNNKNKSENGVDSVTTADACNDFVKKEEKKEEKKKKTIRFFPLEATVEEALINQSFYEFPHFVFEILEEIKYLPIGTTNMQDSQNVSSTVCTKDVSHDGERGHIQEEEKEHIK
ncbi:conserved protein, unknown function, partial [Hepatocystis sp. ex Piliocolobus tephrosceles]